MRSKAIAVAACWLALGLWPVAPPAAAQADGRPNIVVIYTDDVSPHDGRLWQDPALTPVMTDLFVEHGINFTNAIGETSLCCPARGSMLTGQHTFNHRVLLNDARLFNPGMHIGKAMKDAGYATMWIGKYLNRVNQYGPADWQRDGVGWTYLDAINALHGDYYGYNVHTKTGTIRYRTHSTRMVAERALLRFSQVPEDTPLFAVLSVFNLHSPNKPLPEFADDSRCSSMPPWHPDNYNEADVSDKPPLIRNLNLLPNTTGWPMVGYCREMLGIEWLVDQVVTELTAEGRLQNTLLVLTSDNGMAWGAHRLGQVKSVPYSTPIPLYFSFPGRWGRDPRQIDSLVSNIDFAPTFCALAGDRCRMGPYPDGQAGPDGTSLLPLIEDSPHETWRNAALEAAFLDSSSTLPGFSKWRAIRTDTTHPLGAWHYVEWADGFKELYNLENDEFEMENKANEPTSTAVMKKLADELAALWVEGRSDQDAIRPDALIGRGKTGVFYGSHVYSRGSTTAQLIRYKNVPSTSQRTYWVQVLNRSSDFASLTITGSSTGSASMSVKYLRNGVDVTSEVTGEGLVVANVRPGNYVPLAIRITATNAPSNARKTALLTARRSDAADQLDVITAVMAR